MINMQQKVKGYTSVGGRGNNEDAYAIKICNGKMLLAVADGLGGVECGELASSCAISTVLDAFKNGEFTAEEINNTMQKVNQAVCKLQQQSGKKMKTTLCVVLKQDDMAVASHVGDSRIYALKDGKIIFQSEDHSASQLAVMLGEITKDQIRHHEERNILTRAMGAEPTVKASVTNLKDFDSLLVCTDGFWEYVTETDMESTRAVSKSAAAWLRAMKKIHKKNAPSGVDNNTAVVFVQKGGK